MTDAYVDPRREAWDELKTLPRDQPIQMLNLIRLKAVADYPADHPDHGRPITGAQAYRAYGRAVGPLLDRAGARQVWAGKPQLMVIGPQSEAWDLAFVVEYPAAQAFIDMIRDPHYRTQVAPHRTAAVADSRLLRLTPRSPDVELWL